MNFLKSIVRVLLSIRFLIRTAFREGFRNPYKGYNSQRKGPLFILANGPSLSEFLEAVDLNPDRYIERDYAVVNDFVNDPHFCILKPKYCVMSDPLFFFDTIYSERGRRAINSLVRKVDWPMLLIVPQVYINCEYLNALKNNANIKILAFHSVPYSGSERLRQYFFQLGLGNGEFGTVALNALYSGIMLGYKDIYLYGIDHNFFDELIVNDKNELCHLDSHFYENGKNLRPILNHYGGLSVEAKPFRVSEFLYEKGNIFRGHEIVNAFAKRMGVRVYNCTKKSMVDEYIRVKSPI